jgi:hypothetical protein
MTDLVIIIFHSSLSSRKIARLTPGISSGQIIEHVRPTKMSFRQQEIAALVRWRRYSGAGRGVNGEEMLSGGRRG